MNRPEALSVLIKPISSSCNLKCPYCFYMDVCENRAIPNYGAMTQDTVDALTEKALDAVASQGKVTFAFQGGEPTLIGLDFYKSFINTVMIKNLGRNIQVSYSLQTNGTTLDDAWFLFLKQNNVLVGVSLDGFKENTNAFRIDYRGSGQFHKIMETIDGLKKYNIDFNILTVLTQDLARKPQALYDFYKKENFNYIQIIPCLPELNPLWKNNFSLTPELFASFYTKFFELWYEDNSETIQMSVGLFDNLIRLYKGMVPMQCGMLGACAPQLVIEADGSVYPCDFYVLDEYRIGNICTSSIEALMRHSVLHRFLNEGNNKGKACEMCPFENICHGNCKRQNVVMFNEQGYCGYKEFLTETSDKLNFIANK